MPYAARSCLEGALGPRFGLHPEAGAQYPLVFNATIRGSQCPIRFRVLLRLLIAEVRPLLALARIFWLRPDRPKCQKYRTPSMSWDF